MHSIVSRVAAATLAAVSATYSTAAKSSVFDTVETTWQCASTAASGYVDVAVDLAGKAAKIGEIGANYGYCSAVQGGNSGPYLVALGALSAIKIASPDTLRTGYCHADVKAKASRPLADTFSSIVPIESVRSELRGLVDSKMGAQAVWDGMKTVPLMGQYLDQIDCACTTIDNGIALTDFAAVTGAIGATSDACAGALDELGLGFINDWGGVVSEGLADAADAVSKGYDALILGEGAPMSYADGYQTFWAPAVADFARGRALDLYKGVKPEFNSYTFLSNWGFLDFPEIWEACFSYFDGHQREPEEARDDYCDPMRDTFSNEVVVASEKLAAFARLRDALASVDLRDRIYADHAVRLPPRAKADGPIFIDGDANRSNAEVLSQYAQYGKEGVYEAIKPALGSIASKTTVEGYYPWGYDATGFYGAARQLLPVIGYDVVGAVDGSYAAWRGAMSDRVYAIWNAEKSTARRYYLARLTDQGEGESLFGCPNVTLWPELAAVCRNGLASFYDGACHDGIARMFAYEARAALVATGLGLGPLSQCRKSLIALADSAGDVATAGAALLSSRLKPFCTANYPMTLADQGKCGERVRDVVDACAASTFKAATAGANFSGCVDARLNMLKLNRIAARPVGPIAPREVDVSKPGALEPADPKLAPPKRRTPPLPRD